MLRPNTLALTGLLALLTAIGPLSVDMYSPSLPAIARAFNATDAHIQLSVSAYLIGFAIGQIIYGPLSDRFGRKPVIVIALVIYIAAGIGCLASESANMLILARCLQAIGASGAIVLARAVVRDLYEGAHAGRELSLMSAIMAFAPILAPLIGGFLQTGFGWQASFVLLASFGVCAALATAFLLPETLPEARRTSLAPGALLASYKSFLVDRSFRAHLGIVCFSYAGLFAWISGSPFILQGYYGLSAFGFGMAFAIGSMGYLVGTTIAARTVVRRGLDRTLGLGCATLAAGGLLMIAALAVFPHQAAALVLPIAVYLAGLGLTLPQGIAGALMPFPHRAGTASSLLGFIQQSSSALVGVGIGHTLAGPWPLAATIALAGVLALAMWSSTHNARRII